MPDPTHSAKRDEIALFIEVLVKRDDYVDRVDFFFSKAANIASEFGCFSQCSTDGETEDPVVLLISAEGTPRTDLKKCLDSVLVAAGGAFEQIQTETTCSFGDLSSSA